MKLGGRINMNKLTFIGAGSMAEAILTGVLAKGFMRADQISVTNKDNQERLTRLRNLYQVNCTKNKKEAIEGSDVLILSMKPKDIQEALTDIKSYIKEGQIIVSVLAGVSSDYISEELDITNPIVRAMPNTSATIGFSATAIAAGKNAGQKEIDKITELFKNIGTTVTVEEKDLHAITGLSGSGPAYIYYLVEAMEEAAKEAGLDQQTAKDLIIQTLAGAAEMLKVTNEQPAELRRKITSPGGTTQAGLETLKDYNYQEALKACVKQAAARSVELGSPYRSGREKSQIK